MQKIFKTNSAAIAYRIMGEGIDVVLLHGFGEDSNIWNNQIDFLTPHCRLIVPDLPGSGRSVLCNNEELPSVSTHQPSSIEYYADQVRALLQHENISSCIMLGHSMGGYITLSIAENFPSLLNGFGLIHSSAFADTDEKKETRLRSIILMEDYGAQRFLKNTTPLLFGQLFKNESPEKVNNLIERGNNFSKLTLQQYYTAIMKRPDRTAVLKASDVPVLFIIGTEDIAAPMEDVLQQVHLPKIAYIHILEQTGHMGMLEDAEKMNTAILEFIKATISIE